MAVLDAFGFSEDKGTKDSKDGNSRLDGWIWVLPVSQKESFQREVIKLKACLGCEATLSML